MHSFAGDGWHAVLVLAQSALRGIGGVPARFFLLLGEVEFEVTMRGSKARVLVRRRGAHQHREALAVLAPAVVERYVVAVAVVARGLDGRGAERSRLPAVGVDEGAGGEAESDAALGDVLLVAPVFEQYAVPITALVDAVHALHDACAVAGRDVVAL